MPRYKFHSYWEKEYFVAFHEGKAQRVICSKVLSVNSNFTLLFLIPYFLNSSVFQITTSLHFEFEVKIFSCKTDGYVLNFQ